MRHWNIVTKYEKKTHREHIETWVIQFKKAFYCECHTIVLYCRLGSNVVKEFIEWIRSSLFPFFSSVVNNFSFYFIFFLWSIEIHLTFAIWENSWFPKHLSYQVSVKCRYRCHSFNCMEMLVNGLLGNLTIFAVHFIVTSHQEK